MPVEIKYFSAALAQSGWKKRMLSPWARWAYRQAACVHVTSATEADAVRNFWGDQVPRIVCLPEGVDVGEVTTCESAEVLKLGEAEATSDANRTNSSFVLRPSSFSEDAVRTRTVLYLGRVSPEKNLDMLVDAWVRLPPESRLGWRLRLIGFPPKGQSRYADAWGRKHAVQSDVSLEAFCGVDEKWKALAESDVFVLPSRTENFGIVVAEALACGVPVIATKGTPWSELLGNEGGSEVHYSNSALVGEVGSRKAEVLPINDRMNSRTNELTRPGRAGWWIDVGVEPLVAALREAMRLTDEERQALGESGRSLVEAKYQWPKIAKAMERVYEEIIAVNGNKQ